MPGKIVKTKSGTGKIDDNDKLIGDKILVYLDDGRKMLIHSSNIEITGYWD